MGDQGLCVSACRDLGFWGELLGFFFLAGRALYLQWKAGQLKSQKTSLQEKVVRLESMRPPPPMPVSLQLPDELVRALRSLAPPPPPSSPSSSASLAPPDLDHLEPPDRE
jgi:hypothetical protein